MPVAKHGGPPIYIYTYTYTYIHSSILFAIIRSYISGEVLLFRVIFNYTSVNKYLRYPKNTLDSHQKQTAAQGADLMPKGKVSCWRHSQIPGHIVHELACTLPRLTDTTTTNTTLASTAMPAHIKFHVHHGHCSTPQTKTTSTELCQKRCAALVPRISYQSCHRRVAAKGHVALPEQPSRVMLATLARYIDGKLVPTTADLMAAVDASG